MFLNVVEMTETMLFKLKIEKIDHQILSFIKLYKLYKSYIRSQQRYVLRANSKTFQYTSKLALLYPKENNKSTHFLLNRFN